MKGVVAHFVRDVVELGVDDADGKALSAVRVDVYDILGLSCHCGVQEFWVFVHEIRNISINCLRLGKI